MRFMTLGLSVTTVGMATLALAAPASAQQYSTHTHYAHTHYHHYHHYAHYGEGRQIIVHSTAPVQVQPVSYASGPVGAVGSVVGGTGQAVQSVFIGAGGIVGGVVGGVLGGVSALFGGPGGYAYGAPFAAPFSAAGTVAGAPFEVVGGSMGAPPPAHVTY